MIMCIKPYMLFPPHTIQNNFDVFNALDIFENEKFLHELKFGIGDGHLEYYIYNWRCPAMRPDQTGLVLL